MSPLVGAVNQSMPFDTEVASLPVTERGGEVPGTRSTWLVVLLTLIAAALRLHGLLAPLDPEDLTFSQPFLGSPWPAFWHWLWNDQSNMIAYYVPTKLLGTSALALRTIPFLASIAAVPALYWLGTKLYNATVGVVAAGLIAVSPAHIHYSLDHRGSAYSLVMLLVVITTGMLWTHRPHLKYLVAFQLAAMSHIFAVLVAPAHLLRHRWLPVVAGALSLPFLWHIISHDHGQIDWIPPVKATQLVSIYYVLVTAEPMRRAGLIDLMVFAGVGALWILGRDPFLVAWAAIPVVEAFVISVAVKHVFIDYYLIVILPALILLAARGIHHCLSTSPASRATPSSSSVWEIGDSVGGTGSGRR